jgi:hypothetical protein
MILRLLRTAATAAAVAVVTLAQLNLPSSDFWQRFVAAVWTSVGMMILFSVYDAVGQVNYAVRAKRIGEYENDIQAAMSAAVASIVDEFSAPWDEIAVCYYRTRFISRWRKLVRVGAVRAGAILTDGEREFRPGVGPVGLAFNEMVVISVEWQDFVKTATNKGPTAWNSLDLRERYSLTWGQLMRSWRPDAIVTSPTFNLKGKPDGCILIAGPLKPADLQSDKIRTILNDCATVIDKIGPLPKGWWKMYD